MTIHFYSGDYLKSWPNWSGVIPQIGDTVLLHFGDNEEVEMRYCVVSRVISGIYPNSITINLEWLDKEDEND